MISRKLSVSSVWLLLLALVAASQPASATHWDDCAGGSDASDTFVGAHGFIAPIICNGAMNNTLPDPADWYYVDVPTGQISDSLYAEVCPSGFDADIYLYFQVGGAIVKSLGPGAFEDASTAFSGCDAVSATVSDIAAGGRWYIEVFNCCAGTGTYQLTVF